MEILDKKYLNLYTYKSNVNFCYNYLGDLRISIKHTVTPWY